MYSILKDPYPIQTWIETNIWNSIQSESRKVKLLNQIAYFMRIHNGYITQSIPSDDDLISVGFGYLKEVGNKKQLICLAEKPIRTFLIKKMEEMEWQSVDEDPVFKVQ